MDYLIFLGYEILSALIPFLIILLLFRNTQKKKGVSYIRYSFIAMIVFAVYLVGVYHFTGAGTIYDGLMYRFEWRQDQFNWIPFSNDIDVVAYVLNVVLFIPLGLFVPIIWKKLNKLSNILATSFLFTILIEASQLLNNRRTDIDDILLNVLGAVVGFGLFRLFDKITKSKFHVKNPIIAELMISIVAVFLGRFFLYNEMGLAKILYGF